MIGGAVSGREGGGKYEDIRGADVYYKMPRDTPIYQVSPEVYTSLDITHDGVSRPLIKKYQGTEDKEVYVSNKLISKTLLDSTSIELITSFRQNINLKSIEEVYTHIIGPMSYVYIHSENYNKNIYLFGFNHAESMDQMHSKFLGKTIKCHGGVIYNFNKLIQDLIQNNPFFNFDLFLESSLISLSNKWKKGTKPTLQVCRMTDGLCRSELEFDGLFYTQQSQGNYRAHLIDARLRGDDGLYFNYEEKKFTSRQLIDIGTLALHGNGDKAMEQINSIFGEDYFYSSKEEVDVDKGKMNVDKMNNFVNIVIVQVIESELYVSTENKEKFKKITKYEFFYLTHIDNNKLLILDDDITNVFINLVNLIMEIYTVNRMLKEPNYNCVGNMGHIHVVNIMFIFNKLGFNVGEINVGKKLDSEEILGQSLRPMLYCKSHIIDIGPFKNDLHNLY